MPMDGQDWLRAQLTGVNCVACGQGYVQNRIRVLAHREDLWFVSLKCSGCGTTALGLVTVRDAEGDQEEGVEVLLEPRGELTAEEEARLAEAPPFEADDVLAMHEFLAGFSGDFRSLFRQTEER